MTTRSENRKRAYQYIMRQSEKLNLTLHSDSYKTTTDVNYISLDDIVRLKKGLADPPPELVLALRNLLKGVASEAEIDEYLVRPFQHET